MTGVYFGLIVALLVAWYQKFGSGDVVFYYTGVFLIGGVFGALLITQELLPYKNWFKRIDGWLNMIEGNQRIPDLKELVKLKDRLQSTGHMILIFLVVLNFYFTVVGPYDKVLLFVAFLIVGILVTVFTHGGIDLIKKDRK